MKNGKNTKTEVKYTPGPWLVMGNQRNGHFDYVLPMSENKEFQANVRLIAAAPELLEALKAMHKHFITEAEHIGEREEVLEAMSMKAITLAEGGK